MQYPEFDNSGHRMITLGKQTFRVCSALWMTLICSCQVTPQPPVVVSPSPSLITRGIDARDYNAAAQALYQSLAQSAIPEGAVIALGPIATNTRNPFDPVLLQEKLMVALGQTGRFRFSYAVSEALLGEDAAQERYKIMKLEWDKSSTMNPELLHTIGTLANIDYLLFGRVTEQITSIGNRAETTLTYVWKLGRCNDGIVAWADEFELSKQ